MLYSRLNALVLANINQKIIHTIEMGIYNNKLCNVNYLFSNIFLLIVIQIKYY